MESIEKKLGLIIEKLESLKKANSGMLELNEELKLENKQLNASLSKTQRELDSLKQLRGNKDGIDSKNKHQVQELKKELQLYISILDECVHNLKKI